MVSAMAKSRVLFVSSGMLKVIWKTRTTKRWLVSSDKYEKHFPIDYTTNFILIIKNIYNLFLTVINPSYYKDEAVVKKLRKKKHTNWYSISNIIIALTANENTVSRMGR